MVAMILAWQRDLHVLHHSQGNIVANCSYLGGSVPTLYVHKGQRTVRNSSKACRGWSIFPSHITGLVH